MRYLLSLITFMSLNSLACLDPYGEISIDEYKNLKYVDTIFVGSLESWKELEPPPPEKRDNPYADEGPLAINIFKIESTIIGKPLNSYFTGVCFGDFEVAKNYIIFAYRTRVIAYSEYNEKNIQRLNAELEKSKGKK